MTVRSLGRAGARVGVADCCDHAPSAGSASRWAGVVSIVAEYSSDANRFVDDVLRLTRHYRPRVVVPIDDGSIAALLPRREEIGLHSRLALANDCALRRALDKTATLSSAVRAGVRTPHGAPVTCVREAEQVVSDVGFPAVVKPACSWAARSGVVGRLVTRAVVDTAELRRAVQDVLEAGTTPVVQEWLPGRREAIHLLIDGQATVAAFAHHATRMLPPIGGSSVVRTSITLPPDTLAAALALVRELGLDGYCEVEFRRDRNGEPNLMEVNPRLSASVEVAVRAGIDFPRLLFAWAAGDEVTAMAPGGYRSGVRLRWLGGDLQWLRRTVAERGHPDVPSAPSAVAAFVGDFLRPCSYDYVDRHDLRPALVATRARFSEIGHSRRRLREAEERSVHVS